MLFFLCFPVCEVTVQRLVWSEVRNAGDLDRGEVTPGQPGSRQLPLRLEELDGVSLGPLGKNRLLCDEAMSSVGGVLVKEVLGTLVPAAHLVVMVGHCSFTLQPEGKQKGFY